MRGCTTADDEGFVPLPKQELAQARKRADAAGVAAAASEKALSALEVGVPKARMEAAAARERASDLTARLAQLCAGTQVPTLMLQQRLCGPRIAFLEHTHPLFAGHAAMTERRPAPA